MNVYSPFYRGHARSHTWLPALLATFLVSLALAACAADSIEDRQYGQQVVCHGNKTLTVSNADSFVHLDHGDSLGPCPDDS